MGHWSMIPSHATAITVGVALDSVLNVDRLRSRESCLVGAREAN